jgi:hypothetical protein
VEVDAFVAEPTLESFMKLPTLNRIIVLATLFSVSLGLYVGYAVGRPQGRTNDLPSAGPPNLESNYKPWYKVPQKQIKGWVRDYQPNNAEKQLLVLSREDQKKFADLINQPDAGGFRLFSPHPGGGRVISIDNPEYSRRPGFSSYASTYSFKRKKHGHGVNGWDRDTRWNLIDLQLIGGKLRSAVTEESVGLMVQLGDVPLEQINEQTAGIAELAEFVPPADHRVEVALFQKNLCGYERNGFRYGSNAVAVVNNTYVLRSTLNQRADQLIAFRVIGEDAEGTLSIVWRKLKNYPKPSWTTEKHVFPTKNASRPGWEIHNPKPCFQPTNRPN